MAERMECGESASGSTATSDNQNQPTLNLDFSTPDFQIEDARKELEENGVVVIRNVIPQTDCDTYIAQIKDWLSQFGDNNFPNNIQSIIHKYNIAHIEPAWKVRLQVKPIFSALWKTEKLLTSTDGIAVGRPPESGSTKFGDHAVVKGGLHFDQGPHRQGLHAYQGAVYLEEASEDDWCFAVMEHSNHYHKKFFDNFNTGRSEFRKLKNNEVQYLQGNNCPIKRIAVPKGGIVLWDSRTVHAGAPPLFGRSNIDRWRHIVFVSQTPAIWATPADFAVKREAYHNLRCSRHWSSYGASNFRTGKGHHDIMQLPEVAESLEAKQLAGVEPYEFGDGKPNGPRYTPGNGAVF